MAETYLTELDFNGVTHVVKDKSALTSSSSLNPSNLSSAVSVSKGGTGATSASSARSNLGLGSAATYSATSSVTSGSSSLVTSGAVYSMFHPSITPVSDIGTKTSAIDVFDGRVFNYGSLIMGYINAKLSTSIAADTNTIIFTLNSGWASYNTTITLPACLSSSAIFAWCDGSNIKIRHNQQMAAGAYVHVTLIYPTV